MAVYSDEKIDFFHRAVRGSGFQMPQYHYHDKHELYYLEHGRAKYFIGSDIYLLEPGDMVFVPKGVYHKTDRYACDWAQRLLLVFDDAFAGSACRPYIDDLCADQFIRIAPDQLYHFRELFCKIEQESRARQQGYREMEQLYLHQMMILIRRYRIKEKRPELSETYQLIQQAVTYISLHYGEPLSLDFLAGKFAFSRSHFSKLFKKVTGVGLNEYINITRITEAEKAAGRRGRCDSGRDGVRI